MSAATVPESYDQQLDLRELLNRLWRGRRFIAVTVVVVAGLFTAAAFVMTPKFRASAVLVPATAERGGPLSQALGSLGGLAAIAGIDVNSTGTKTAESLAVLRSREFTEGFITEHELLPVLYASKWDATAKRWKVPAEEQPTLVQAYKLFDKVRTATEDKKTGMVKVQVEWKDPEQAAAWVNALVARTNAVMRARAISRTDAYLRYLQKELDATTAVETRNAIGRLMESQINERMFANVTQEYAFRVVDRALVPDRKDPVRPKKALLIILGIVAGVILGAVGVLVRDALWAPK